jgi:hypothetical protein
MNDEHDTPGARHRRVHLELPPTVDLQSVEQAEIAVILAAAEGRISSRAALDFTLMLEHRRRTIADRDFEARLDEIEEANRRRAQALIGET